MREQSYKNVNNSQSTKIRGGETKVMKRILSSLIVLALVLTMVTPAFANTTEDLGDYASAVNRLASFGVLTGNGDGTFQVESTMTRAEFAAMAVRLLGLEDAAKASQGATKFKDGVAPWASGYVNVAVQQGVLTGYADGTFGEKDPVTQAQVLAVLVRALGYEPQVAKEGWPTNYMVKAIQLGLTDDVEGVSAFTKAKRGDIFKFANNSLAVKMLEQVEFGTSTKFVVGEKTLLDGLNVEKVKGYVTDIARTNSSLEDNELKIDGTTYVASTGIDFEQALNTKVTAYVNSDDEIIDVTINSTVKYDAVDYSAADQELTLIEEDVTYDVDFGDTDFAYDYAKVRFDADGNPDSLYGFLWDGSLVVAEVDGDVVYSVDEELDLEDYTLVKEGKTIAVADVVAGDILFYDETNEYAEVYNNSLAGDIEEIYTASFVLDGETYTIAGMYVDADDTMQLVDDEVLASMQEEGGVTVFFDRNGDIVFVSGDLGVAATTSFIGYVVEDSVAFQVRQTNYWTLDVLNENGEVVKYDVKDSYVTDDADPATSSYAAVGLDWDADINKDALVKVTLKEDGSVKTVELLSEKALANSGNSTLLFKTTDKFVEKYSLNKDAVVFLVEDYLVSADKADIVVTTLGELDFDQVIQAQVFANANDVVTAVVVEESDRDSETTDYAAVAKADAVKLSGEDTWKLQLLVDGVAKTYYTEKDANVSNASSVTKYDIVEITVDDETNEVTVVNIVTSGTKFVTGDVYTNGVTVRDNTIELVGNPTLFKLEADSKVYDVTGTSAKEISIRELKDGYTLEFYLAADNSRFVKYALVTAKPVVSPTPVVGTGDFTVVAVDTTNDILTLKDSNNAVVQYQIPAGGDTIVELTDGSLSDLTTEAAGLVSDSVNLVLTQGTTNVTYITIIAAN